MMKRLLEFLKKIGLIPQNEIYYIGGTDILPPPLKGQDEADAFRMLSMLSGRSHQVMTGLSVVAGSKEISVTEVTDVYFRELTEAEIRAYIRTKDPMDKAGSYGIQSGAAVFVEKIYGDYFNVVGLPVARIYQEIKKLGLVITND